MTLVRWQPQPDLLRDLGWEIDRVFDDMWVRPWNVRGFDGLWMPAVDIEETESEYQVRMDLPGIERKDIKVTVRENTLTIEGERKQERTEEESNFSRTERRYGSFRRSFTLTRTVDAEKIRARYNNGVLVVSIPKREEAKPREIDVTVK